MVCLVWAGLPLSVKRGKVCEGLALFEAPVPREASGRGVSA